MKLRNNCLTVCIMLFASMLTCCRSMERQLSETLQLDTLRICRNLVNSLYLDLCDTIDITITPGTMTDSLKQAGTVVPLSGTRIVRHMTAAARQRSADTTTTQQTRSTKNYTYRSKQRHVSHTGLSLFLDRFLVIGIFLSLSFVCVSLFLLIGKKGWPL